MLVAFACQRPVEPSPAPVLAPAVVDVVHAPFPLEAHGRSFTVTLDRPAVPTLTCTTPDDPDELHVVVGTDGLVQTVDLFGLLADTVHDCVVSAGGGSWTMSFRTEPEDPAVPGFTVAVDRGDADGAYTLLNHWVLGPQGPDQVLVVDLAGRVRWAWTLDEQALPDVDFRWVPEEKAFLVGGGSGYAPRFVRLDGTTGWTAPGPDGTGWYHHHTERLADGQVLSLATERGTWDGEPFEGVQLEVRDPLTDRVSWAWHGQQALDAGTLPPPSAAGDEPWHANAVQWVGDAALVDFKHLDVIVRIDADTGDLVWTLGHGRDFALVDAGGALLPDSAWFYGQHDPHWDVASDRVLLYDNGVGRPGPRQSRVLELAVDVVGRTATPVWSWTEPGWYEPLYGGADRLPGGHVLIAMGHSPSGLAQGSAVVEVDPDDDEVVWRLALGDDDGLYRAERVDGCALFANRRYCPP